MAQKWSQRFHDKFGVHLSPDVVDWLDGGLYELAENPYPGSNLGTCCGGFSEPVHPEQILDSSTSIVWGGLMLPDTLPILDNGCGDVLALRFGEDDRVREVIRWNHEGGDWKPYGETLAEAMLCDVAASKLEGSLFEDIDNEEHRLNEWAVRWAKERSASALEWPDPYSGDDTSLIQALLKAGICEVFCRRELCQSSLMSGLHQKCCEIGGGRIAQQLGVEWRDMEVWLLDTGLIPEQYWERLSQIVDMPLEQLLCQDWDQAVEQAQRVRQIRSDLSWPYGVMGYAFERVGDYQQAISSYVEGLEALGTSDGLMEHLGEKFVIQRLRQLKDHMSGDVLENPYLRAAFAATIPEGFPSRIRCYWIHKAQKAEGQGQYDHAYRCYYNAGWDDFMFDDMEMVLDGLARTAEAAGYTALHRIAKHHRACLNP